MTAITLDEPPGDSLTPRQVGSGFVWTLRTAATLLAVSLALQPFVAGMFVSGNVSLLLVHAILGGASLLLSLILLVTSVLLWRPGRASPRAMAQSAALLVLIFAQGMFGMSRMLEWHFPLAFILIGLAMATASWAWRGPIPVVSERKAK